MDKIDIMYDLLLNNNKMLTDVVKEQVRQGEQTKFNSTQIEKIDIKVELMSKKINEVEGDSSEDLDEHLEIYHNPWYKRITIRKTSILVGTLVALSVLVMNITKIF